MKKVLTVFLVFLMVGCLAIPCFAAEDNEFTPSISGMVAPVLRPVGGSSATDGVAEIWYVDDEDHILEIVIPRSYISITPYADADKVGGKIGEDLKKAYAEIVDAECLGELHNGLDALVKEMYPTASCDDLIATDLFDMTLVHDPHHERVQDGEAYLRVRFDIGKTAGEPNPIVLHRPSDEIGWMVVDPDRVIDMGDGTVRVDFETLCPIAFLAVRADAAIPAPTPESCGCPDWCFLCPYLCFEHFCACILAYIVIALILLVIIISIICAIAGAARRNKERYRRRKKPEPKVEVEHVQQKVVVETVIVDKRKKQKVTEGEKASGLGLKDAAAAGMFMLCSAMAVKLFLHHQDKDNNKKK